MLTEVQKRIQAACARGGRNLSDVLLVAVSKRRSAEEVRELYQAGLRDFGESRVQELLKKKDALPSDIRWHFIGNLQTNKIKYIVPFVYMVHSIQSQESAQELSNRAKASKREIPVCIEVNISGETQKHGITPKEAEELVTKIAASCPNLIVSGPMGMASFEEDPEKTRPQFRKLRELLGGIRERHPELKSFKELSMGMSNDFEVAIEEGATIVRIGSALFSTE